MTRAERVDQRGSASIWAVLLTAGAFTLLLGLVVDGGRLIDARVTSANAAGQAARAGADSLSTAAIRNGDDQVSAREAVLRAQSYLHRAGLQGRVRVAGNRVTVTVTGRSHNEILRVVGIDSFPVVESETARAVTEQDNP